MGPWLSSPPFGGRFCFALATAYFVFISRHYAGKVSVKRDTRRVLLKALMSGTTTTSSHRRRRLWGPGGSHQNAKEGRRDEKADLDSLARRTEIESRTENEDEEPRFHEPNALDMGLFITSSLQCIRR